MVPTALLRLRFTVSTGCDWILEMRTVYDILKLEYILLNIISIRYNKWHSWGHRLRIWQLIIPPHLRTVCETFGSVLISIDIVTCKMMENKN